MESCQLHRASGANDDHDEEVPLVLLIIIDDHEEVVALVLVVMIVEDNEEAVPYPW